MFLVFPSKVSRRHPSNRGPRGNTSPPYQAVNTRYFKTSISYPQRTTSDPPVDLGSPGSGGSAGSRPLVGRVICDTVAEVKPQGGERMTGSDGLFEDCHLQSLQTWPPGPPSDLCPVVAQRCTGVKDAGTALSHSWTDVPSQSLPIAWFSEWRPGGELSLY